CVIVDFTVEHDLQQAVLVRHRLPGRVGQIDDCEPPVRQADTTVGGNPGADPVGAAMRHRVADPREISLRHGEGAVAEDQSARNATHERYYAGRAVIGRRASPTAIGPPWARPGSVRHQSSTRTAARASARAPGTYFQMRLIGSTSPFIRKQ